MKKPLLFIIPIILLGITSCKKLGTTSANISEADAVNIIGTSLASGSSGLTTTTADASVTAQAFFSANTVCGGTKADSVSHQSGTNSTATYGYKAKFTNKLTCNTSNQPDNITHSMAYSGYFNGPNLFITNTGTSNFVVAGLTPGSTVYAVNGEFKSTGTFKLKADTTNNGTISIDIAITNLIITKSTVSTPAGITGGSATIAVTGNVPKKGAFTFNGALAFTGNSSAKFTIGSNVYVINLITGAVTKQ